MGQIVVNGHAYKYVSQMVETDYGPENEVTFSDETGTVARYSECMRTDAIVEMFRENMGSYSP